MTEINIDITIDLPSNYLKLSDDEGFESMSEKKEMDEDAI
jgi:hypothetical protein